MSNDLTVELSFINHRIPPASAPMLFSVMRNETYFLPFFLQHYRRLGIQQFWIYADRCNSKMLEILESQSDVTVLTSNRSFEDTFGILPTKPKHPRRLIHYLKERIQQWLPDRWVLTVDADEFLILPPPAKIIDELIEALELAKQYYCFASLVDYYPQTLAMRNYNEKTDPFVVNRLFDAGPYYRIDDSSGKLKRVKPRWVGVRPRLLRYLKRNFPVETKSIYGEFDMNPPSARKIPLMRNGAGIVRIGNHNINEQLTLNLSVALAHFKFYPGTDDKINTALSEGQYYRNSMEYRLLNLAIEKVPDLDLTCKHSTTFTGAQSLVDAKLLSTLVM